MRHGRRGALLGKKVAKPSLPAWLEGEEGAPRGSCSALFWTRRAWLSLILLAQLTSKHKSDDYHAVPSLLCLLCAPTCCTKPLLVPSALRHHVFTVYLFLCLSPRSGMGHFCPFLCQTVFAFASQPGMNTGCKWVCVAEHNFTFLASSSRGWSLHEA